MSLIKWLGGKSQVLHIFKDYFPNFRNVKGYIEPFVGDEKYEQRTKICIRFEKG